MTSQENRRLFLKLLGTSAGSMILTACGGGGSGTATSGSTSSGSGSGSTSSGGSTTTPPPANTEPALVTSLKAFFKANATTGLALPATATAVPTIAWAGAFNATGTPATTLPNGVTYPLTNSLLSVPIFNQYAASLPGSPTVAGYPCLVATRNYTCKGVARTVGSAQSVRLKTDAAVVEFSGVMPDGNACPVTLIVDGTLVPAVTLSGSLGQGGGYDLGTIRVDFGSSQTRDIYFESFMWITYVKLDQNDTLTAVGDTTDPQITAVGDSYLGVRSANFPDTGAIALSLGARLGMRKVAIDSLGGTGYYNSGADIGNLNDRLPGHAADNSSIYLIMAGLNDYGDLLPDGTTDFPTNAVWQAAVQDYLQGLRTAQPNALIVVCAPFCPDPPMSDSSYVTNTTTNPSGQGDFLYKEALFKSMTSALTGPWIYIDVLMGSGWINSSGATGDATGLQWFTGGTAGAGTTATYKPGDTLGGGGGGFGGIESVPIVTAGQYSQAPNVTASGGTGSGVALWASIDGSGNLTGINVLTPGSGYTSGSGLPTVTIDPTFQLSPTTVGQPTLTVGTNPNGQYPLLSFAPAGVTAAQLNNIYTLLSEDLVHPGPLGAEYLAQRLAQNIYDAVMAL